MSWWDLTDGSWLGDAPADLVRSALGQAVVEGGSGPVTAADLLASVAEAIRYVLPAEAPAAGPAVPSAARPTIELQPANVSSADGNPVPGLVHGLRSAFAEAALHYRRQFDRDPTATELAQTVLFVARPAVGELIRSTPELELSEAVVRGQNAGPAT